jgi:hypothetical protein
MGCFFPPQFKPLYQIWQPTVSTVGKYIENKNIETVLSEGSYGTVSTCL